MKSLTLILFSIVFLAACNNNPDDSNKTTTDSTATKQAITKTACYLYTNNKDTVSMKITISNNSVSGELEYKFSEKDMNQGVIQGEMRGDTLLAEYEFKSEGIVSVREVAFLMKEEGFAEGYGEAEEKDGKMMFKNVAGLNYTGTVVLKKVNCVK